MRPVDQTGYGVSDGNCLSAALASILEVPVEAVPRFVRVDGRLLGWLADRALSASVFPAGTPPAGYSIAVGPSLRFAGLMHACVAYDGAVVHDPHPSREGLPIGAAAYVVVHGPRGEVMWFSGRSRAPWVSLAAAPASAARRR